jgi:hypothetical protein
MKVILVIWSLLMSVCVAEHSSEDLGLLANYYRDCPASHGARSTYLRAVIRRALSGDEAAMRGVILHEGIFSTGDNEGYSEVPKALLLTVADDRYADFVARQPRDVQEIALAIYPQQIPAFERRFPRVAKLYRKRFSS